MSRMTAVRCAGCDYAMVFDSRWNGLAYIREYYVYRKASEEEAKVTHCPGCGEALLNEDDVIVEEFPF